MGHGISRRGWFRIAAMAGGAAGTAGWVRAEDEAAITAAQQPGAEYGEPLFDRVILEMSLKPFRVLEEGAIREVCKSAFRQWGPLIARARSAAVLLWTADGSEILDYAGRADDPIEWARYIGIGTPPEPRPEGPAARSLHSTPWLYMERPPEHTYATLATIVRCLKEMGAAMTGKPVAVGATFDPGPEFANSEFKYKRHPEIAVGATMGANRWVSCSAVLKGDDRHYAGFPEGIAEGTTLGTFLGRQSRHFLADLGFDYLWLSNGFGFSLSSWSVKGVLFDGKAFDAAKAGPTREAILGFWRDFRKECPDVPIETRGSNLTVGADLASGGSPLAGIYRGGFGMVAPPNSPWAALDGDFGLELVGYLSRISELPPGDHFPFRFYTHDPWWLNSPWFDRYGREPHDIYLPLALARVDGEGQVTRPTSLALLTIDDSYGRMPEACPREVIPHIMTAMEHYSDAPGPLVWVYPFDEYHDRVFGAEPRIAEPFFGDWFVRGAVNAGLPLNTVVSTGNYLKSVVARPELYRDSVLLVPVPDADSAIERALLDRLKAGQDVLLYGPTGHASEALREAIGVRQVEPMAGELEVRAMLDPDRFRSGAFSNRLRHNDVLSAGGVDTAPRTESVGGFEVVASVNDGTQERAYATFRAPETGGSFGRLAWVRGSFSNTIGGGHLPVPDDPAKWFPSELLLRWVLERFGLLIRHETSEPGTRRPLVLLARHRNGYFASGYGPSTATRIALRLPHGAPLLVGTEASVEGGRASYVLPRAWHREVRVLVEQKTAGEVSCVERYSGHVGINRRLHVRGLKDATVHFYPETEADGSIGRVLMAANDLSPYNESSLPYETADGGRRLVARGITGELLISW